MTQWGRRTFAFRWSPPGWKRRGVLLGSLITICSSLASAQWRAGAEIGAWRFWGGAAVRDGGTGSVPLPRPYRPTIFGVRLERSAGAWGVGLELYHAGVGIALEDESDALVFKGQGSLGGVGLELERRVARLPSGVSLALSAGPTVELWHLAPRNRVRLGARGAFLARIPLTARIWATLRLNCSVTPSSIFFADEVSPPARPTALWRRGVSGGVVVRL